MNADALKAANAVKAKLDAVTAEILNLRQLRRAAGADEPFFGNPLIIRASVVGEYKYAELVDQLLDHMLAYEDQLKTEFEQL